MKKVTKSQEVFKDSYDNLTKDFKELERRSEVIKGWTTKDLLIEKERLALEK
jgi:hypothetical protein